MSTSSEPIIASSPGFGKRRILGFLIALVVLGYFSWQLLSTKNELAPPYLLVYAADYFPGDTSAEYISYSVTEELIRELAGVGTLRVIAAPSVAALRYLPAGSSFDTSDLKARYYLKWNMVTMRATVVFDLELHDTTSMDPIWISHIEQPMSKLPSMLREIADTIAERSVGVGNWKRSVSRIPDTLVTRGDSFIWYLYGRFTLIRPEYFNLADAVMAFQRSLQDDPDFPQAHAALAWTLLLDYESKTNFAPYHVDAASVQVKEALLLNHRTAETLRTLGLTEQFRSNYDDAMESLEEALELGPNDAESHRRLAELCLMRGRTDAALLHALSAKDLDPLNEQSYTTLGRVQEYRRDFQAAVDAYVRGAEIARDRQQYATAHLPEPLLFLQQSDSAATILHNELMRSHENYAGYYRLGRVHQEAGQPQKSQEAFDAAEKMLRHRLDAFPNDITARAYFVLVLHRLGKHDEAAAEVERVNVLQSNDLRAPYLVARAYALEKDAPRAAEYLSKAIERKYDLDQVLDMDFAHLWSDPRFAAVIRR
jgi:tetratricopeptide (TPR) repeat protein/TolB-like protein